MQTRVLGNTGLPVSQLALGGLFVSSAGGAFEQSKAAVHRALELGVNYIDTAPTYYNSEEVLGKILRDVSTPLILSTKLGGRPQPFQPQDITCLKRSVEQSLHDLGREYIDILMVHEPDRPGQYAWWTDNERYDGPVVELLDDLKRDGLIRFTGIGGTTAYELANVIDSGRFDVVLTAYNYSLLWREAEHRVLPASKQQGMGIIIGSPLQQGALARRYDAEVATGARWLSPGRREQLRELYALLDELDIALPELAIRFVISNPDVSCVLMGVRSPAEVEQNAAAVEQGPLTPEVLARLDVIAAMVPFRPFDEPAVLPFGRSYAGPSHVR